MTSPSSSPSPREVRSILHPVSTALCPSASGLRHLALCTLITLAMLTPQDSLQAQSLAGTNNVNLSVPQWSVIVGGRTNAINASVIESVVAGGASNNILSSWSSIVGGVGNLIQSNSGRSIVGGGLTNTVFTNSLYAGVFAGRGNKLTGSYSFIGGGQNNTIAGSFAVLNGGYLNSATGTASAILGGTRNTAQGFYATIGGGQANSASGSYATIIGGFTNTAVGAYATVLGGRLNVAAANYAIAAGYRAKATNRSTFVWADSQNTDFSTTAINQFLIRAARGVGINTNNPGTNSLAVRGSAFIDGDVQVTGTINSGTGNIATGTASVIGGGVNNTNSGTQSTIAGGNGNAIYFSAVGGAVGGGTANLITNNATNAAISGGEGNTVGGNYAFVGAGFDNGATGVASVVSGGEANVASGNHATVPGGLNNEASGVGSFAAGVNAKATNDYSFVWGGAPDVDTVSTNPMSYTARAPGGFLLLTSTNAVAGLALPANSSTWASLSDSNAKTDIRPVDYRNILAKVAALPVTEWRYKHDPRRRYIGPMAQDFHAAFGLGFDDKHISTLDTDGVTLAAIKGLVQEIENQDQVLDEREAQIDRLEDSLRQLREQLSHPDTEISF